MVSRVPRMPWLISGGFRGVVQKSHHKNKFPQNRKISCLHIFSHLKNGLIVLHTCFKSFHRYPHSCCPYPGTPPPTYPALHLLSLGQSSRHIRGGLQADLKGRWGETHPREMWGFERPRSRPSPQSKQKQVRGYMGTSI